MITNDLLHFAFEYLDRGWPVIPVLGKTPVVSWASYQKQRPSVDEVREWFASSENYNLAVVTGQISELVVIDCDTAEDAAWWREHHALTPLEVTTGRGGKHFYYRHPHGHVGNRTSILDRSIDVRGDGGLVVAPPSVHPETGNPYRWSPWDHYARDDIPVLNRAWLEPAPSIRSSSSRPSAASPAIHNGCAYITHIRAESGNGGHNATFRAACALRDSGLAAEEAIDALKTWNETNASPPWTEKELVHKVHDAYRAASP
jgi:hypothetical protein